jgi:hypothetical protein
MRWAQQRGLPVKRIPGGKVGTVYALAEELDAWAASQGRLEDDPQTSAPEGLASEKRSAPAFSLKWALVGGTGFARYPRGTHLRRPEF